MSASLYFIGTLHAGITSNNELGLLIEEISPDQILVEIAQEDLEKNNLDGYPPEMIFAYDFAKNNNILVNGFDLKINVLKAGVTEEDSQRLILLQKKIVGDRSWKDFNRSEDEKELNKVDNITDWNKWRNREIELGKNIRKIILKGKKVLVITGCGHLDFFEQLFEKATFPLR